LVKGRGLTMGTPKRLTGWRLGEGSGISGVAVKCVDIRRKAGGEGGFLEQS
jgi:hypothetical protein